MGYPLDFFHFIIFLAILALMVFALLWLIKTQKKIIWV